MAVRDKESVRMQNCGGCGRELLSRSEAAWADTLPATARVKWPPVVAGTVDGSPACGSCWRAEQLRRKARRMFR